MPYNAVTCSAVTSNDIQMTSSFIHFMLPNCSYSEISSSRTNVQMCRISEVIHDPYTTAENVRVTSHYYSNTAESLTVIGVKS